MFPLIKHAKTTKEKQQVFSQASTPLSKYLILLIGCVTLCVTDIHPTTAHKVQIAQDVGGTLHIEPNDNPRAGEATQAWFALTRKGGKVIPLQQCDCQLAVYAEPHTPGEPALLEPSLKPVNAEIYQGIPGAEITFPKPGIYQLQLSGKPISGANFKPFAFAFEVTVAAGTSVNQNVQNNNPVAVETESNPIPIWAIALPIFTVLGILFVVWQKKK
jgi:hypothetical protein